MDQLFLKIVELAVSATGLILAVTILRPFLKKAPKWITCMLWVLVGLRLIIPIHVETAIGLMPKTEKIAEIIGAAVSDSSENPFHEAEYTALHEQTNISDTATDTDTSQKAEANAQPNTGPFMEPAPTSPFLDNPDSGTAFFSEWIHAISLIWLAGVTVMLLHLIISYARLRNRLKTATLLRAKSHTAGIKQSEYVDSPFILGLVKPYIYIPYHMEDETLTYVLAHEETHLRHRDHWLKMTAYLLLCVYWFHPLVWLAYALFCRDLELNCDERVITKLDEDERRAYARALLHCVDKRLYFSTCPLGFGETGVKERIIRMKMFKKPSFAITILCIGLCSLIAVCFITNPSGSGDTKAQENENITNADGQNESGSANIQESGNENADNSTLDGQNNDSSGSTVSSEDETTNSSNSGNPSENAPINTEAPESEPAIIDEKTRAEIAYIKVTNGDNGQSMQFAESDAGNQFIDLLNLYQQLDTSGNAEQNTGPNARIGYKYCMRLYDQNDTLLQTVTPYKDGFTVDSVFYASDMTVDHTSVDLMNYIDLLFNPGLPIVETVRKKLLFEILEQLDSLTYRDETCDGLPEITLQGNGTKYQVNLSERWVWKDDREATLSEELAQKIQTWLIMK